LPGSDKRPDPEIVRDAIAAIASQLPALAENIKLIAKAGWMTLEGEVEWNYQRERAETAVRWLRGVKGITNLIRLKPQVAATEIKRKIAEALRRSAEIDASRLRVETDGHSIVLTGTVRSWAERDQAERAAWSAPGVTHVENRIVISP
jgi:osmotically-inducible protein OsmY